MFDFATAKTVLSRPKAREKSDQSIRTALMFAEKPSIAKAIADALSSDRGPRQKRGISKSLPVYEFSALCKLPNDAAAEHSYITVTGVVGHVFSLGFNDGAAPGSKRQNVDPEEFFEIPVVKKEETTTGKLRVIEHLLALTAASDHLVLWLGCDAEGEHIAHEVIGETKQAMAMRMNQRGVSQKNDSERTLHRAFFSAITAKAIQDVVRQLGKQNEAVSRSVDARQELDLRVGVAFTRRCSGLATKTFSRFTKLFSYGPRQTPTLSFCIDRANEGRAFEKQAYQLPNKVKASNGVVLDIDWISPDQFKTRDDKGESGHVQA